MILTINELIQTFNFGVNEVRTAIKDNGDVYFCLTDVADVLEISRSSDLLRVQKDFVFNEIPKNRGTLNLKTDKYGMRVLDKARGHSKRVETFRYYDNVIPVLKSILESEVNI